MSLVSTYNSIKQLLVTKLTNKGVTANTNQGLTTLINKIDDIEDTIPTTVTGENISGVYSPNVNIPISTVLKAVTENEDEVSINAPLENAEVIYDIVGANNYYNETLTTNANGVTSFNFNTENMDTYTVLVSFIESKPFGAVTDFVLGTITIFESIINCFQNISFSHSNGSNSRSVSYVNNESVTMTTQTFEDASTVSVGAEVDYLLSINSNTNYQITDTVISGNQGYNSFEYEAQGIGDVYIKAQSHKDSSICTEEYVISDWIKKDFTGIGNWVAFSGRVNTFSSNTDTVFTQGNGSKGGVHSQNTVFHLPNDDYIVSFKVANGTIGTAVRIGLHSASYDDHHEKAVVGIENDSSGGFKFDYSDSTVTTVTKVATNLNKLDTDDLIEFRVVDDTVEMFINGTSYVSPITLDWLHTPIWLYAQSWATNNGNFSITDFRVRRVI